MFRGLKALIDTVVGKKAPVETPATPPLPQESLSFQTVSESK